MLFSSITFLYYFLPIVLIFYFLTPKKGKNLILLISSMIFYGWGEPIYIVLMLLSILVYYVLGLLIERHKDTIGAKIWLILSVCFSFYLSGATPLIIIENSNAETDKELIVFRDSIFIIVTSLHLHN